MVPWKDLCKCNLDREHVAMPPGKYMQHMSVLSGNYWNKTSERLMRAVYNLTCCGCDICLIIYLKVICYTFGEDVLCKTKYCLWMPKGLELWFRIYELRPCWFSIDGLQYIFDLGKKLFYTCLNGKGFLFLINIIYSEFRIEKLRYFNVAKYHTYTRSLS